MVILELLFAHLFWHVVFNNTVPKDAHYCRIWFNNFAFGIVFGNRSVFNQLSVEFLLFLGKHFELLAVVLKYLDVIICARLLFNYFVSIVSQRLQKSFVASIYEFFEVLVLHPTLREYVVLLIVVS